MAQTVKKQKSSKDQSENGAPEGPSLSDRAQSGARIADHVRKAAEGGSIRKGFSLWRVARELPTAASGAGDLFKRHPVPIALLGGVVTTGALLVLANGMGAFDADDQSEGEDEGQEEGQEEGDGEEEGEEEDE